MLDCSIPTHYYKEKNQRGYNCEEGLLVSGVLYSWKEFKDVKIEDDHIILSTPINKVVIKKKKTLKPS